MTTGRMGLSTGALLVVAVVWACGEVTIVDAERPCRDEDYDGHLAGCAAATDCNDYDETVPGVERCNGEDDDCDGVADEGFPGLSEPCTVGDCAGVTFCERGAVACGRLDFRGRRVEEDCNGRDDDCDGVIDESAAFVGQTCVSPEVGRCAAGRLECADGLMRCAPVRAPASADEICDGFDDDCDDVIDEDTVGPGCYPGPEGTAGVGACQMGTRRCAVGRHRACVGAVTPEAERCDGVDEDCDGVVDEGLDCACADGETRPCPPRPPALDGRGPCVGGEQRCIDGAWGRCVGRVDPRSETCDGVDEDCDGAIDEGAAAVGQPCEEGLGECRVAGTTVCVGGRLSCDGEPRLPRIESCDRFDRNCDGVSAPVEVGQPCESGEDEIGFRACNGWESPECTPVR